MEISQSPLVSVIIPVYNANLYLSNCIENILNQTYKNIEIIIVDDGSTDNSAEIAERYPVKLLRKENQGVSAARNNGIDLAQGQYLHFMDADDLINDLFYENLVRNIQKENADMACAEMINQHNKKQTHFFKASKVYKTVPEKLKATYVGRIGYVWRYLFRTEFLKNYNIKFEEGRIVEDLVFSLTAVFHAQRLVVVPQATYTYIHREDSQLTIAGQEQQAKRDRDWQHARAVRKAFAKKHGFKIPGVNSGKFGYFLWQLKNSYRNKRL